MNIFLARDNTKKIMVAKLWINDGSRADPKGKKGIHQILSSTISRGCGPLNNIQLAEIVENYGSNLNCETYEDGILISLKCMGNDAYKLLPLIGWMITKPSLDIDQIELEKDLTINALKRQKESSYQQAFDAWRQMVFQTGPYGHDPLGLINDLYKINKKDLLPIANSLINRKKNLVIEGFFPNEIEDYIKTSSAFKKLNLKSKESLLKSKLDNIKVQNKQTPNICIRYLNTEQIVFLLGKATVSYGHKSDLLLRLISCYLGYGMSSLLFKTLREKYGVVYEVGTYHPIRESKAPFIVHASTTEDKALLTIQLLKECWDRMIYKEIRSEELILIKNKFRGQMAHSLQSISQRAERKAHLLGIGQKLNYDNDILKRLEIISSKDIRKAAEIYLRNPSLSVCGKEKIVNQIKNKWKI